MAKVQYYFENEDSEICYNKEYFINEMKENDLYEMEVIEAIRYKSGDTFWCKNDAIIIDESVLACGKQCNTYEPRNGKSGCCRYHSKYLYEWGEKVTLKIN
jgi:hypothetical protein